MLEKIDLNKKIAKEEYKKLKEELSLSLGKLQRELKTMGIPVIVVFEGLDAAGKGRLINKLIEPLDPRGFYVYAINGESEDERMHPFLWRFWTKTPERGRMDILRYLTEPGMAESW